MRDNRDKLILCKGALYDNLSTANAIPMCGKSILILIEIQISIFFLNAN